MIQGSLHNLFKICVYLCNLWFELLYFGSSVQRLEHRLRVGLGHTEECAGGAFGAAVSLFPVPERMQVAPVRCDCMSKSGERWRTR